MRYAQIKSGRKLHLVFESGEGIDSEHLTPAGHISAPLCHTNWFRGTFRMSINLPLANACRNCMKAYDRLMTAQPTTKTLEEMK